MAHKYRYEFRDLLTNEKLGVLPLYGVNMSWYLATKGNNTYGDFTGTFKTDTYNFATSDVLGQTQVGRTALWVYRDNVPIWSGILWSRTYSSQAGGTFQFYAQAMDSYAERYVITANQSWFGDARNIVREAWLDMISDGGPEWNIGLQMPPLFTTSLTNISKAVVGNEQVVAANLVREMIDYGVEYRLGYKLTNNVPSTSVEMGRWDGAAGVLPVGTPPGYSSPELVYPGDISHYWTTDSASKGGTHLYGIGKGNGASTPRGEATNDLLLAGGYPGLGLKLNFRDTETQALLDDRLVKAIPFYSVPIESPSLKLSASANDIFGTFAPGDYVYVIIRDPQRYDDVNRSHVRVMSVSLSPGPTDEMDFTIAQPSTMVGEG